MADPKDLHADCCCKKSTCWKARLVKDKPWLKSNVASSKISIEPETQNKTRGTKKTETPKRDYENLSKFQQTEVKQPKPKFLQSDQNELINNSESNSTNGIEPSNPNYKTMANIPECFPKTHAASNVVKDCFPLKRHTLATAKLPTIVTVSEPTVGKEPVSKAPPVMSKSPNEPPKPLVFVKDCFAGGYKSSAQSVLGLYALPPPNSVAMKTCSNQTLPTVRAKSMENK